MATDNNKTEKVDLNREEMDIITMGLDQLYAAAGAMLKKSTAMKAEGIVRSTHQFRKLIEAIKVKML